MYKKLKSMCTPQGAFTNNAKFISPLAPIYYDNYTPMMKYPGPDPIQDKSKYTINNHHQKINTCSRCVT